MIAIFDSGFGGLSIFREIEKVLPHADLVYLGDQLRVPYGGRSREAVTNFSREAVEFLRGRGASLIIFACHTASNLALRSLQSEFRDSIVKENWNILGVTIPLAEAAAATTRNKKIGIVGTRATIDSQTFPTEIKKLDDSLEVFSAAAPLLVPLVEEDWLGTPEFDSILAKYLQPILAEKIDTLVLGCTHFPLAISQFQKLSPDVTVLDSGKIVAEKLQNYLARHPEISLSENGRREFLTTDCPEKFAEMGAIFRGEPLPNVEKVELN